MTEIIPNLYLGNEADSHEAWHYNLVVNATENLPDFQYPNVEHIRISVNDVGNPDDALKLYEILSSNNYYILHKINNYLTAGKKVLIHCRMGQQRSACVVACYLIYINNYQIKQSIEFIRNKKKDAFLYGINFYQTIYLVFTDKYAKNSRG